IKQYTEFGMNASTPVIAPFVSDGQMWALGERANGLFGKAWHYSDAGNSDAEKKFAAAYEAKYRKPPLVEAWQGWTAMRMVLGALEPAGPTDGKALVGRLEALKVDNGGESLYFRPWDHQLIRPMLVVRGKPPAGGNRYDVLDVVRKVPARSADLDAVFGSKADVGCTMGEP
ncbi:MAG: ABC transporter substrate-binding protein, partial [Comamonadaceae bacterium]